MPLLSKLPVEIELSSADLNPFSVLYIRDSRKILKTFKSLVDLLHNQYDLRKLSSEDKQILGRRKLYPEIDEIFQYEETYSWLLALTRSLYVNNSIMHLHSSISRGLTRQIERYYYLISKYPPKVLDTHTDSCEHTYSLISSLV